MSKLPISRPVAGRSQPLVMPRRPTQQQAAGKPFYKGRAVGSLVPQITRKVFEKFGFSTATLLTDWAVIVGPDLAAYTAPERLKWPRGFEGGSAAEPDTGRPGATLLLRVKPARALDVQYKTRLLTDRINAYFGYRAIAEIRIVQAPLPRTPAQPLKAAQVPSGPPSAAVTAIDDEELRAALGALEASIRAEKALPRR